MRARSSRVEGSMAQPTQSRQLPNIDQLPGSALLTRAQVACISNFSEIALRHWAQQGRGPRITTIEGRPRYAAKDVRAWLTGQTASTKTEAV